MDSKRNWQVRIRDKVCKNLLRLPPKDRVRIFEVFKELPYDPFAGDIEKMKGEQYNWRRRVGSYRIFYELMTDEKIIYNLSN